MNDHQFIMSQVDKRLRWRKSTLMGLGTSFPNFSALPYLPAGRQSSAGWIDQATINSFANAAIWLDAYNTFSDVDATVAALTGDNVKAIKDNASPLHWTQANVSNQMTLAATPQRLEGGYNKTVVASPEAATGQNIVIATNYGILNAVGNIPASLTVRNVPGMIHWVSGAFSAGDIDRIKAFAIAEGAVDDDFGSVANFSNYFRAFNFLTSFQLIDTSSAVNFSATWFGCSGLTSFPLIDTSSADNFSTTWLGCSGLTTFPLIDTSSVKNFNWAWRACSGLTTFPLINTAAGIVFSSAWHACSSLTSFPLLNVSLGTNFVEAWRDCTSLTTFPANFFDGCSATSFTNAFNNTALTEASIDGILVSINSNGTSGGNFLQSGGTAPSVATGRPAIDALRARGWTVTVTGGY